MFPSCLGGGPITCRKGVVPVARRPESCIFRYDKVKVQARVGNSRALWSRLASAPTAEGRFSFGDGMAAVVRMVWSSPGYELMRLRVLQTRSGSID